jgi:hypothetical protein
LQPNFDSAHKVQWLASASDVPFSLKFVEIAITDIHKNLHSRRATSTMKITSSQLQASL